MSMKIVREKMKKIVIRILLIALLCVPAASATSVDWLYMCNQQGSPGDTITQTITLEGTIPAERTGYWSIYYKQIEGDDEEVMDITPWISVEPEEYMLNKSEIKTFTVTIKIPNNAEPGVLYGATSGNACEKGHSDERRMYIQFQDANTGGSVYSGLMIPISVNVLGKQNPMTPVIKSIKENIIVIALLAVIVVLLVVLLRRKKR